MSMPPKEVSGFHMPSRKTKRRTRLSARARRPKETLSSNPSVTRTEDDPDVSVGSAAQRYPSASAFVRTQPVDIPAKQVVAAGAKVGLKLTPNLVRIVRYKMRRAGLAKPVASPKRPLRKARPAIMPAAGPKDLQFKRLVVELGIARARTLVEEVARSLESLIAAE